MDVSELKASSSSEALAQAGHRTCTKSRGRGKVEQTLSLVKRVVGSKITGTGLVMKKGQVLVLGLRKLVFVKMIFDFILASVWTGESSTELEKLGEQW